MAIRLMPQGWEDWESDELSVIPYSTIYKLLCQVILIRFCLTSDNYT